jgi:hypothetical protein
MLVRDIYKGFLYHFDLNENRTQFSLDGTLKDMIANQKGKIADVLPGQGLDSRVTDIEVSPYDGYVYVVTSLDQYLEFFTFRILCPVYSNIQEIKSRCLSIVRIEKRC